MKSFEPRKVPVKNQLMWAKGALELASRNPLVFILIWAGATLAVWLLPNLSLVHAPISIVFLAASFLAAESADKSKSFAEVVIERIHRIASPVITLACGYGLIATFLTAVFIMSMDGVEATKTYFTLAKLNPSWINMPTGGQLLYSLDWVLINTGGYLTFALFYGWFSLPLTVSAGAPLPATISQSFRAIILNLHVIPLLIVLDPLFRVVRLFPIAGIPVLSIVCCIAYMSYKDIWLGTAEVDQKIKKPILNIKLAGR